MLIIGLTGGIASGKSLVARVFRDMGAHIVDADRIVHQLLASGQPAWKEVLEHFGESIRLPDNEIDRHRLGEIVFNDPVERAWLNNQLHPRVFDAYLSQVHHLSEREPDAVVVLDAALLVETGYHRKMDKLVVVYADEEQQLHRLMERDGLGRGQAMARIRSQIPLSEKRSHADYIVDNTGTREEAERSAREVFERCKRERPR